ncbi:hypothetical protein LXL04_036495 [Taraxacum kok-saghyz]
MAATASQFKINQRPPKRGDIKLKIFKTISKSLKSLATGVPGDGTKAAGHKVGGSTVGLVGELKSASEHGIKRNHPRRGQIKIKIFKMIAKFAQNLAGRAAGGKKKPAGNEGGSSGCFTPPAIIIPVETVGALEPAAGRETKQRRRERGQIKIKICKTDDGSVIEFSESGGKDEMAIGRWFSSTAGIVSVRTVNGCE